MKSKLCNITDIADPGSKEFSIKSGRKTLDIFVVHKDSQFHAYTNSCPHTGATLNWQEDQFLDMDNNFIQCSVHDALFEIESGYCVSGPCSGQAMHELALHIENDELYLLSN